MRIRVRVDVRLPLKREKRVRKAGGEAVMCKFQYERLPDFCYICGKMGHTDRFCEVLFRVPEDQIVRLWGKEQRAPPRRSKPMEGDRYLVRKEERKTDGEWQRNGGRMEEGGGSGGREQGIKGLPRGVAELLGNLGACEEAKDLPVAYGGKVVEDEQVEMEIAEEQRKRRREGSGGMEVERVGREDGKPVKSPKKDERDPKNVSQASRAYPACPSS
ncbi:hypothetical protein LINPERHAP1_LOCUS39385 [Linum perenne]